jgi:acyl carrier protein
MISRDSLEQCIKDIVVEAMGLSRQSPLDVDANFAGDLGANSLDIMEIIMGVERVVRGKGFPLVIPDSDVLLISSVRATVDYLIEKL